MIDPDDEAPARLEPPPEPPAPPEATDERVQRMVAVLIMVVTLLGAVFAFLQTTASNRSARATRRADTAAVESLARLSAAGERIAAENRIWTLAGEDGSAAVALNASGDEDALALGRAYFASYEALLAYTDLSLPEFQVPGGGVDWAGFVQSSLAGSYRAAEYQEAYATERDGWSAKGGVFVVVITILAVSLFLLGLSRTPAGEVSGMFLAGAGTGLAAVAVIWGLGVLARPVVMPSAEAIDAYVSGKVAFWSAAGTEDPARAEEEYRAAEADYGRAIAARPGYADAYYWRAAVRIRLDFARPEGPAGSPEARDDLIQAVSLDPLNAVAWNDLAAVRFWLGDLAGATADIRTALEIEPDNLLSSLNLALFLIVGGDTAGYEAQLDLARGIIESGAVPAAVREYVVGEASRVLDVAAAYRPDVAPLVPRLRADLRSVLGADL